MGAGAPAAASGVNLGAGVAVGVSGVGLGIGAPAGGTRAEVGIGGGAPPPRLDTSPAAPATFAAAGAGGVSGRLAGAWLGDGGVPADPPRSNDNPDGGGPDADPGEAGASKSKLSGGPPLVGAGGVANDSSSAKPSGGVLLETLSEPGSHPGRAQLLD